MGKDDKYFEKVTEENSVITVDRLIELEWEMFQKVRNEGGRADCQDDKETFYIMRQSQLEHWPSDLQESYLRDLLEAKEDGRNLLSYKYAYMMERTAPGEFQTIRKLLPVVDAKKQHLVDQIVKSQLFQFLELARKYRKFSGAARSADQTEDAPRDTSFETYLWGELKTYSTRTLKLYAKFMGEEQGEHLVWNILNSTAKKYGYASLDEAEKRL